MNHKYKVKVWLDVARWMYSVIAQIVTLLAVLSLKGIPWYLIVLIIAGSAPIVFGAVYLYMTYIFPGEQEYLDNKRPVQKKILDKVTAIEGALNDTKSRYPLQPAKEINIGKTSGGENLHPDIDGA